MGRVFDCKQRLWAQVKQKKTEKKSSGIQQYSSLRPNTKYGENIFQSGGKAAQDQAQGAVDMWWGPVSKRKLNLSCILHCTGTPRSRTTVLGQSQAREALSQDISPRSWRLAHKLCSKRLRTVWTRTSRVQPTCRFMNPTWYRKVLWEQSTSCWLGSHRFP